MRPEFMRGTRKLLVVVGVLLIALLVGAVVGWFAAGPASSPITDDTAAKNDTKTPPATNVVAVTSHPPLLATNRTRWTPRQSRPARVHTATNQVPVPGTPSPIVGAEVWESKVDAILTDSSDDSQKARKMLE